MDSYNPVPPSWIKRGDFDLNRVSPQATGLVGWWVPSANKAGQLIDLTGHGYDGTLNSNVSWDQEYVGTTIQSTVTASHDGVSVPSFPFLSPPLTLVAWARRDAAGVSSPYFNLMAKGGVFGNDTNFAFGYRGNPTNKLYIYWRNGATLYGTEQAVSIDLVDYHLYVATIDSSYDAEVFFDGVSQFTDTSNAVPTDGSQELRLGSCIRSTDFGWDGHVLEWRIYDRVLSADEVWQLWDASTRWDLYRPLPNSYFAPQAILTTTSPILWQDVLQSRGNVLFTELNSLADSTFSNAGIQVDNTVEFAQYGWLEFVYSLPVAPSIDYPYIEIYMIESLSGVLDFEDGGGSEDPARENLIARIPVRKVTTTQSKHIGPFVLPPSRIKFVARNKAGVSLAGSSNRFELWTNNNELQ